MNSKLYSKKALLFIVLVPTLLTVLAVMNPIVLYSYDGRRCSRADLYLGPFMIGSVEISLREIQCCPAQTLMRVYDAPTKMLQDSVPMVGIRCLVNKTLKTPTPGAPEDTVGVGLIVRAPDGSRSILLCTAAPIEYAIRRTSVSLGEIYECASKRIWQTISPLKGGNVSTLFLEEDFFPAFSMMVRDKEASFLEVEVVGVYVLSDTVVYNDGGRYIGVKYSGVMDLINGHPSHITVNGTNIPLRCGIAKIDNIKGICVVKVPGVYLPLFGTKEIQFSIEL
ncbi:MAG: hypothetical protein N3D12_01690 [Candidatus Methanomethyliaceae archaeon]|nr:hypothetical protein [Candidatus Methanomethyliaceae archaeon]